MVREELDALSKICLDCGKCCRTGWTYPLTLGDADHISAGTGLPMHEFTTLSPITELEKTKYGDHPMLRLGVDGKVLQLKKTAHGTCVFHDAQTNKCTIHPFKPLACRTFPFVYDETGEAILEQAARDIGCPLVGRELPGIALLRDSWITELGKYKRDLSEMCAQMRSSEEGECSPTHKDSRTRTVGSSSGGRSGRS